MKERKRKGEQKEERKPERKQNIIIMRLLTSCLQFSFFEKRVAHGKGKGEKKRENEWENKRVEENEGKRRERRKQKENKLFMLGFTSFSIHAQVFYYFFARKASHS